MKHKIICLKNSILKNFTTGYSLIELLVVIAIMAIIGTVSIASFTKFNDRQVVEGATSDVASVYNLARQRALSQIKPTQCLAAQSLRGFQVQLNTLSGTYQLNALCGNANFTLTQKTLPTGVTFASTSPTNVIFNVPSATVSTQGVVTINGYGKTKTITINTSGILSVQ
jgi:prepilin-type N-terminal cleavage/methylation domain-containing protein